MSGTFVLILIFAYFGVLFAIARVIGRKHASNAAFFLGNRKSPWHVVAIGMVGASLSGVTFVSVPGMVVSGDMTYMQMVLGFLAGYAVVAFVLLPIYYRRNLTSIYTFLDQRLGRSAYKTGAGFFLLARTIIAAARLYLAAMILQTYVFDAWHIPFAVTAVVFLLMIWLYTYKSGVRTIVWTDLLQTFFLIAAVTILIVQVMHGLHFDLGEALAAVENDSRSRIFVFGDWSSRQNFFKQFIGGMFIVIAMTGIDQEMMQKNLSCRNLREAQKNVCACSLFFIPVNLLFLVLGILLLQYAAANGITAPTRGDDILPVMVSQGYFGAAALLFFVIGVIAATFASADSALAGLTTSICVDMLNIADKPEKQAKRLRLYVHCLVSLAFITIMLIFRAINNSSVIDSIYTVASYCYGPLLGLFAFAILFRQRKINGKAAPFICILSPILCYCLNASAQTAFGYTFGYELLVINAALVVIGLRLNRNKDNHE